LHLLIAGNLANTGYYLTAKLREFGIEADLLMQKDPPFASDPKNTGKLSESKYPDWIKIFDKQRRWKRKIIKTMKCYDLISAATEFPIFALFSNKPYVAVATGSDLYYLAQSRSLKGFLLRLAYRKAKVVVFNLPSHLEYVNKLKLKHALFLPLFREFPKLDKGKIREKMKNKFIFFHPTSQIWKIKRNDIFLKAYVELCKSRNDVYLILINRGEDSFKTSEFLKKASIEGKYEILPSTLNQVELASYYQLCDVVIDQFGVGSVGFIGLESLNFGKPLVSYIDTTAYQKLYGEKPPILSSNSEEEVYQYLKKLVEDRCFYDDISERSRQWIFKFHSEDELIKKYWQLYTMVNERKKFEEIAFHLKFN
jgi:glycosyltransferase involved in cell wall biosynthesis